MPIGTPNAIRDAFKAAKTPASVPLASSRVDEANAEGTPAAYAHYGIIGVVALFLIFVVAIQHKKIQDAVKPGNIAFNIWNLFVIFITVIVSFTLFKVAAAKYAAAGLPGGRFLMELAGTV